VKIGVPVAAGVVMAGLLAYVLLVRRRTQPKAASPESTDGLGETQTSSAGDNPEREALVHEIALLDQQFEAGEIEEPAYRAQRAALSARALGESPRSD
jgi:hypothetical protein